MDNNGQRLYTVKQLAKHYNLKEQTIYFWLRYRKFDFIEVGRMKFIRPAAFERFLESHTMAEKK